MYHITIKRSSIVVFDLDDTLYPEIDFLRSGFRQIADAVLSRNFDDPYEEMLSIYYEGKDPFKELICKYDYPFSVDEWLKMYRGHVPDIKLKNEVKDFLARLKAAGCLTGLITDGRSITQRNKLKALELENYFDEVIISEEFGTAKPDAQNYLYFEKKYGKKSYYYIGNNFDKDFIAPNALGWTTIGILDIENNHIHKQDHDLDQKYLPKFLIKSFDNIKIEKNSNFVTNSFNDG